MSNLVLKQKEVKIRKPRKCYGCLRTFEAGTTMEYLASTYEDGFWTCYHCESCTKIKQRFTHDDYEDGLAEGWFGEYGDYKWNSPEEYLEQNK